LRSGDRLASHSETLPEERAADCALVPAQERARKKGRVLWCRPQRKRIWLPNIPNIPSAAMRGMSPASGARTPSTASAMQSMTGKARATQMEEKMRGDIPLEFITSFDMTV